MELINIAEFIYFNSQTLPETDKLLLAILVGMCEKNLRSPYALENITNFIEDYMEEHRNANLDQQFKLFLIDYVKKNQNLAEMVYLKNLYLSNKP